MLRLMHITSFMIFCNYFVLNPRCKSLHKKITFFFYIYLFESMEMFGLWVESGMGARAVTYLLVSEPTFRLFYKMILKLFMTCIAFAYKG